MYKLITKQGLTPRFAYTGWSGRWWCHDPGQWRTSVFVGGEKNQWCGDQVGLQECSGKHGFCIHHWQFVGFYMVDITPTFKITQVNMAFVSIIDSLLVFFFCWCMAGNFNNDLKIKRPHSWTVAMCSGAMLCSFFLL